MRSSYTVGIAQFPGRQPGHNVMLSVKLLCAAVGGSPTSPHALMSREREGERGATNLPTVSHHLLSGNASDGLLVKDRLAIPIFTLQKCHLCCYRLDIQRVIRVRSRLLLSGEALGKLGPKGCANECISWQGSVIEDRKWHTVGSPYGMRLFIFQHYRKTN